MELEVWTLAITVAGLLVMVLRLQVFLASLRRSRRGSRAWRVQQRLQTARAAQRLLDEREIQALPVREFKVVNDIEGRRAGRGKECAVCLVEFEEGARVKELLCGHNFHGECIDRWLRHGHTCPLCRLSLLGKGTGDVKGSLLHLNSASTLWWVNPGWLAWWLTDQRHRTIVEAYDRRREVIAAEEPRIGGNSYLGSAEVDCSGTSSEEDETEREEEGLWEGIAGGMHAGGQQEEGHVAAQDLGPWETAVDTGSGLVPAWSEVVFLRAGGDCVSPIFIESHGVVEALVAPVGCLSVNKSTRQDWVSIDLGEAL